MSDFEDRDVEDREAERVARAFATVDPQLEPADDELRELLEVAGLLAYELDPVEPAAVVRSRLFERLGPSPASEGAGSLSRPLPFVAAGASAGVSSARFLQLAAAAAALIALSLAGLSGVLYGRLQGQEQRLARLELELRVGSPSQIEPVRAELLQLREHFTLVTAPQTRICRLNPRDPRQASAFGTVYMNPPERRWVLTADNLRPTPGLRYQVWFVTADGGKVNVGSFEIGAAESRVEIGESNLPEGSIAVMITLESSENGAEPTGPTILYGEEESEML